MPKSREAYVDTSALIAFLDRSDTHHSLFARLFAAPPKLYTSSLVLAEGHGWFLRRYDSSRALTFLSFIETLTPLRILDVDEATLTRATVLLRQFQDQPLTLADAVGLALIQTRKTSLCWSTDRHLRLTGAALAIDET